VFFTWTAHRSIILSQWVQQSQSDSPGNEMSVQECVFIFSGKLSSSIL
jgi:hypothetical protein